MKRTILLSSLALAAGTALGDKNFNNSSGDFDWFNPANWNQGAIPASGDWTYINNSAIASAANKTTEESPAVINSDTETAESAFVHLGWGADDSGWLAVLSDLSATASTIANGKNSTAGISVRGGTTTYARGITCGQQAGADGTFEIDGGTVTACPSVDWNVKLGENGSGTLRMKSGYMRTVGDFVLGNNPSAAGTVDVQGGELWIGRNAGHWMGHATWRQSAGFASVGAVLTLGSGVNDGVASQSTMDFTGGSLVVSNKLFAGNNGSCDWSQTGGGIQIGGGGAVFGNGAASVVDAEFDGAETAFTTTGEIYFASGKGAQLDLAVRNGTITAPIVNMASASNSVADVEMYGGALNVSNVMRVGRGGVAHFTQSGGDVYVKNQFFVAFQNNEAYDFDAAPSVYRMTGGTLVSGNILRVGTAADGRVELIGGTASFAGFGFIGNGKYLDRLGHGELVVGGEMNATFNGETALGTTEQTATGTLHICGGGVGSTTFKGNVYLNYRPTIKVTVDGKGVNAPYVDAYLWAKDNVTIDVARTPEAKAGTYTALRWRVGVDLANYAFAFAPTVDTARWSFTLDTTNNELRVTLRDLATMVFVR